MPAGATSAPSARAARSGTGSDAPTLHARQPSDALELQVGRDLAGFMRRVGGSGALTSEWEAQLPAQT